MKAAAGNAKKIPDPSENVFSRTWFLKFGTKILKFTSSPTEQTTATTDLLLSIVAAGAICCLQRINSPEAWKVNTWSLAFGFTALSGVLGAVAHGIEMPETRHQQIWNLLNLSLGLAVSVFVVGVAYDLWGLGVARILLPWMVAAALGFYLVTRLFDGIFIIFIIYEAVALLFALAAYIWLALTAQLNGALLISLGVLASIIAAGIQATLKASVKLIFEFDHNGIFHIVQILGILFLLAGLKLSLFR